MYMIMGPLAKFDFNDFYVHRHVILYLADMNMLDALCEQVCALICMCIQVCLCIYIFKHCMYVFSNVYTCLYMVFTLHILAVHYTYLSVHGSSWFIPRIWDIIE